VHHKIGTTGNWQLATATAIVTATATVTAIAIGTKQLGNVTQT
jgi:hypothetical protein